MTHPYTHLRPTEIDLLSRWLSQKPLGDAEYIYDMHLGDGMHPDPSWPVWLQVMAQRLTQRRVDVVAHTGNGTWLIEIKPRADTAAVGQLLLYRRLYQTTYPLMPTPQLGIIATSVAYDMDDMIAEHGITVWLV